MGKSMRSRPRDSARPLRRGNRQGCFSHGPGIVVVDKMVELILQVACEYPTLHKQCDYSSPCAAMRVERHYRPGSGKMTRTRLPAVQTNSVSSTNRLYRHVRPYAKRTSNFFALEKSVPHSMV